MKFGARWVLLACTLFLSTSKISGQTSDPMDFWNTPQHGANSFNEVPPDEAYYRALRGTGATWVRLAYSKWKGTGRDFLIGNADHYEGLSKPDLAMLVASVHAAQKAGLKVVIAPLSLPGCRWNQLNGGQLDNRLWTDNTYWKQSEAFWRDLATAFKGDPAIVGYNILNEPLFEKKLGFEAVAEKPALAAWYARYKGSTEDLPLFYVAVTAAIREVDPLTPVMVDSGSGDAQAFSYWPAKLPDSRTLYSFHMYAPYDATGAENLKRAVPNRYPGVKSWFGPQEVVWDKATLAKYMGGAFDWAKDHGVASNRVVAGEFGCMRQWADCGTYLGDVLDILNARGASWAFYSFREDAWDGMDYELAPSVTTTQFYDLKGQGKADALARSPHPLLDVIEAHMGTPAKKN